MTQSEKVKLIAKTLQTEFPGLTDIEAIKVAHKVVEKVGDMETSLIKRLSEIYTVDTDQAEVITLVQIAKMMMRE